MSATRSMNGGFIPSVYIPSVYIALIYGSRREQRPWYRRWWRRRNLRRDWTTRARRAPWRAL